MRVLAEAATRPITPPSQEEIERRHEVEAEYYRELNEWARNMADSEDLDLSEVIDEPAPDEDSLRDAVVDLRDAVLELCDVIRDCARRPPRNDRRAR